MLKKMAGEDYNALIGLLKPDGDVSVSSGTDVFVKWRDHDPDENAEIRLTLDDDDIPDQNEAPAVLWMGRGFVPSTDKLLKHS